MSQNTLEQPKSPACLGWEMEKTNVHYTMPLKWFFSNFWIPQRKSSFFFRELKVYHVFAWKVCEKWDGRDIVRTSRSGHRLENLTKIHKTNDFRQQQKNRKKCSGLVFLSQTRWRSSTTAFWDTLYLYNFQPYRRSWVNHTTNEQIEKRNKTKFLMQDTRILYLTLEPEDIVWR